MLQQTQVKTVIPRFEVFIKQYPNVQALAAASEEKICQAFAGLGYYHRARNLHRAAIEIVHNLNGRFPATYDGLRSLPGVGNYTAAAVASIAFKEKVASVDGNILRVLARLFMIPGTRGEKNLVAAVQKKADAIVQDPHPGDLNQSLMDLGASVCTPIDPNCSHCPIKRFCQAFSNGCPESFPQPRSGIKRKRLNIVFAWVTSGKKLLVEKRPLSGLWPGLWELPSETGEDAKACLEKRLGIKLNHADVRLKHILTHREVVLSVCPALYESTPIEVSKVRHQTFTPTPLELPLSTLARKAITAMYIKKTSLGLS
jgi:A/G-specific adenine glycosylase